MTTSATLRATCCVIPIDVAFGDMAAEAPLPWAAMQRGTGMKQKQMHLGKQDTLDVADQPTLGMKAVSPSTPSGKTRKRKRSRSWRFWVIIVVCIVLVLVPGVVYGFSMYQTYSAQYQQDRALAQAGVQHLQAAEQLLKTVPTSFDQATILQARQHFSAALADFNQVKSSLEQIPGIATAVPKYGGLLSAALHIVPLAVEVCQAGIIGADALNLVAPHLHSILSTKPP